MCTRLALPPPDGAHDPSPLPNAVTVEANVAAVPLNSIEVGEKPLHVPNDAPLPSSTCRFRWVVMALVVEMVPA